MTPLFSPLPRRFMVVFKLGAGFVLSLLLLLPLSMLDSLLDERLANRDQALQSISELWAPTQNIANNISTAEAVAYFLSRRSQHQRRVQTRNQKNGEFTKRCFTGPI